MLSIKDFKLFTNQSLIITIPELAIDMVNFVYLKGDNATGKSLFLKSLSGHYTNWTGEITFKRQPLALHISRNNIIMINNNLPVQKEKTFLDNINLPFGSLTQKQKNRLLDMATIFEVVDLLNVPMQFSSTSQRMAMYLIRASLVSPSLLLIDDFDYYFDINKLPKAIQFVKYCLKSGMLVIATGKTRIDGIPTYLINCGEFQRLCLENTLLSD